MNVKQDLLVMLDTIQALRDLGKDNKLDMFHDSRATKLNFRINLDHCVWTVLWLNGDGTVRYDYNDVRKGLFINSVIVHDPVQAAEAILTLMSV